MAKTIEELVFKLTADNTRLKAKLKESETVGKRAADVLKKSFRGFLPAASVAGIGILAKQLGDAAKEAIDFADNIEKTADKLGVTTDFLQEMRFAADQSGVSIQTVDLALQRYARRANEAANGTGEAKGAIKELGLELRNADGSLRSVEDTFTDTLAALANIDDPSERLRLAFKLFDSEGVAVVNMAARFAELRKEARELGIVMDESLIKQASEAKGQIDALSAVAKTQLNSALIALGPTLASLAGGFSEVAKKVAEVVDGFRDVQNLGRTGLQNRLSGLQDQLTVARAGLQAAGGNESQDERSLVGTTIGDRLRDIRILKTEINYVQTRLKQLDIALEKSKQTTSTGAAAKIDPNYKGERGVEDLLNQLQNVEAVRRAAFQATLDDVEEQIFNNDRLLQSLHQGEEAYIRTAAAIEAENKVKQQGIELDSEQGQLLFARLTLAEKLALQVDKAKKDSEDSFKAIKDAGEETASSLSDAFAGFATGAELQFDRLFLSIAQSFLRNQLQVVFSNLLGGLGNALGPTFAPLFGKAAGGRVTGPNVVGENGPEIFVPDVAGQIVPLKAGKFGGGSDVFVSVYNNGSEKATVSDRQTSPTRRDIMIMVGEATNLNLASGLHDGSLRKRFALRPVGI